MFGFLTQDHQLAKSYGEFALYRNQFGCNRLFLDVITLMFIKRGLHKVNKCVYPTEYDRRFAYTQLVA